MERDSRTHRFRFREDRDNGPYAYDDVSSVSGGSEQEGSLRDQPSSSAPEEPTIPNDNETSHVHEPLIASSHPESRDDGSSEVEQKKKPGSEEIGREWIPVMLRPWSAVLLATYCLALIVGLELFNNMPATRQGVPMRWTVAVGFANYLPTALVVLLGISWKRLVVDLKSIMPWSCLSQCWVLGNASLGLNYLDDLELSLIWPAARRRHWAVFLGLVGGLLSGLLVPLANSLTSIAPSGRIVHETDLARHSFDFNGTLLESNQTLNLLKSYLGNEPWAGASNILQSGGHPPAWSVDSMVFAPFELGDIKQSGNVNQTITANTTALTAGLVCQPLRGNASMGPLNVYGSWDITIIVHNQTNIHLSNYDFDPEKTSPVEVSMAAYRDPDSIINPPIAWLNATYSCDTRQYTCNTYLTLTVLQLLSLKPTPQYRVTGLLCNPEYQAYAAELTVNATTGIVAEYHVDYNDTIPVDVGLSVESTIGYINNPRHPDTIMGLVQLSEVSQAGSNIALGGAGNLLPTYYTASSGSDPFGTVFLDLGLHAVDAYFADPRLLEADVSRVFATTMTQILSSFAISNDTVTIRGETKTMEPLLQVQQRILRIVEVFLVALSIFILACAWPLRPRTVLGEDPASLHFIAKLVSDNPELDRAFEIQRGLPHERWHQSHFRLRRGKETAVCLEVAPAGIVGPTNAHEDWDTYEPLGLRSWVRFSLLILLSAFVVTLGLLYQEGRLNGYLANDKTEEIAWSFLPTTVLVLVGYAISGSVTATQQIAPLAIMRTQSVSGRLISKFNPRQRSDLTLPYHALFKRAYWPVLLASLIALIYPIIKVVAANLYQTFEMPQMETCDVRAAPLTFNITEMMDIDGGYQTRLQNTAAIRTDWVQLPELGVQSQPNVVRNLVFADDIVLDYDNGAQGSVAFATLEALALDLQCQAFNGSEFKVMVNGTLVEVRNSPQPGFDFLVECGTSRCEQQLQYMSPGSVLTARSSSWDWTRGDPYSDDNHDFYGYAGNTHNSSSVQVLLVDFSSISGVVSNITDIGFKGNYIEAEPGMFNVSLPTVRGLSCTPIVQMVQVQAKLERRLQPGLNGQVTILPWSVTDFDNATMNSTQRVDVSDRRVWNKMFPRGSLNQGLQSQLHHDASNYNVTNWSGLNDDDIQPASGMASDFFELLASFERSNGRNVTSLLDVAELERASRAIYGLYNAELWSHFRQNVSLAGRETGDGDVGSAQLITSQERIRPNPRTTFAVIGMLLAVLLFLLVIFLTTRSKNVLHDKPGMICSQLSLFAGSRLVQRLRTEEGDSVWEEKVSLGWWHTYSAENEDGRGLRWGVDFGALDADLQRDVAALGEVLDKAQSRTSSISASLLSSVRVFAGKQKDEKKGDSQEGYYLM